MGERLGEIGFLVSVEDGSAHDLPILEGVVEEIRPDEAVVLHDEHRVRTARGEPRERDHAPDRIGAVVLLLAEFDGREAQVAPNDGVQGADQGNVEARASKIYHVA